MRGKRAKQYRKLMHAYALSFNFREPYQVLLDADIIRDAARFKMRLGALLENTLQGTTKPMITQCCIRHLYTAQIEPGQKAEKEGWIEVAKQAERRRCGHHELEEPLSATECLKSVVDPKDSGTNRHRYVVASQDIEVRRAMRGIVGVPLIYINRSVMILEPMAARTGDVRDAEEAGKRRAGLRGRREAEVPTKRKRDDEDEVEGQAGETRQQPPVKKKKVYGAKGANPLSVKKSKTKQDQKSTPARKEGERAVIRKAATTESHSTEKARDEVLSVNGEEAPTKRKRKRKRNTGGTEDATGSVHDDEL